MAETQNSKIKSQIDNANFKSSDVKLRAYRFSIQIIQFVNTLPPKRGFWSISDQLVRSATSIGANMVEAKASSSRREFIKFYEISLKSANETVYWICLLRDSSTECKDECIQLLQEAKEISKMIGASILTLKGKNKF